ncbi:hypothetical protein [Rhodococcus globerulus]|uniref:Helix-turn-helix domain-containing protein n=1 Tax=Rhodococcus globerulus TaxID=33008 RepID=A0ABU4C3K3_RHOGO|nr:hypothetical protein [Rhodococcus globerulus]MDV6271086.1 hypothetical protein [Rhodococcus globerulus]
MTAEPAIEFDEVAQPVGRFEWERLIRRVSMPTGVKFLALMLATFADQDGSRVRPGVGHLALTLEVSARTVSRGFVWLRDNGFVTRVRQGNRYENMADEYQLSVPADILGRLILEPEGPESK